MEVYQFSIAADTKLNFVATNREDLTNQIRRLVVVQRGDVGRVEYGGQLPAADNKSAQPFGRLEIRCWPTS
jgi:hypothetical protein